MIVIQELQRCRWAAKDPRLLKYHDDEWGVPQFGEQKLFEALALEIFQAGLPWTLILKRRSAILTDFDSFDYHRIARYSEAKLIRLFHDPSIIRNHAKITAIIDNAKRVLELHRNGSTLKDLTWGLVNSVPLDHLRLSSNSELRYSEFIKPYLIRFRYEGFKRIGPKTLYSYLQAVGVVNDHSIKCFRHRQINRLVGERL